MHDSSLFPHPVANHRSTPTESTEEEKGDQNRQGGELFLSPAREARVGCGAPVPSVATEARKAVRTALRSLCASAANPLFTLECEVAIPSRSTTLLAIAERVREREDE